jgi:hypothetical protein
VTLFQCLPRPSLQVSRLYNILLSAKKIEKKEVKEKEGPWGAWQRLWVTAGTKTIR